MSWEAGLFLVLVVGWFGLHHWLAKAGHRLPLLILIALELISFAVLYFYVSGELKNHPSSGMPGAMLIVGGIAFFIGPAVLGLAALWKYRRASAAE
ncbi:MAG: hypothetical protein DI637_12945 [Citromicrobium sp.]|nr:MAG: hypothetical protein DI637_12945 [Citromicrobium sp.]